MALPTPALAMTAMQLELFLLTRTTVSSVVKEGEILAIYIWTSIADFVAC